MKKYVYCYLLSFVLALSSIYIPIESLALQNTESKNQSTPSIWRAFRGALFLLTAASFNNTTIFGNHYDLFRTLLICSLQVKGLSHIAKAIIDEAYKKNLLPTANHIATTEGLNIAHKLSVLGIGAGTIGYYPTLSITQTNAFWDTILCYWILYLGGCIAYRLFDTQA